MNIKTGIPQLIVICWFALDSGISFYQFSQDINYFETGVEFFVDITFIIIKIAILAWGGFFKIEHP